MYFGRDGVKAVEAYCSIPCSEKKGGVKVIKRHVLLVSAPTRVG
jgi:hypothetical protein